MKVLQIINSLGTGGAEKLLLDSLPRYIEKGVQMDILLLWNNNHTVFEELQKKNICNVFVLKNSSNVKSVYNPLHILKIRKFLKNYDIAHVHLFPALYFAVLAKMFTKTQCKFVFTEHNTNNRRINNRLFYWIENKIYARYQKVVCITQEIQQKGQVHMLADLFNQHSSIALIITPEGTRSLRSKWKTGFYHIAQEANVPIVLSYADYHTRTCAFGPVISTALSKDEVMVQVMAFFADKVARYPHKFSLDARHKPS